MKLSEIFEYFPHGELSNLYSSGTGAGVLEEKHYPKFIANLNLGLIELHKRFPILIKQAIIQLYEHISLYTLDKRFAQSNTSSTELYKYIVDSSYYPFSNDVLKIERVANEDCCYYPLNVDNDPLSFFTPSYNIIQVPYPINENAIVVEYRAYPVKIDINTTDLESVELELPEFLLEPLMSYMAYKFYAGVGVDKPESTNYMQKFEIECKRIGDLGVYNHDSYKNLRVEINGWV